MKYEPTCADLDGTPRAEQAGGPRIMVVTYTGILFGIEWDNSGIYPFGLHVSIRIPFLSFDIGLGRRHY